MTKASSHELIDEACEGKHIGTAAWREATADERFVHACEVLGTEVFECFARLLFCPSQGFFPAAMQEARVVELAHNGQQEAVLIVGLAPEG